MSFKIDRDKGSPATDLAPFEFHDTRLIFLDFSHLRLRSYLQPLSSRQPLFVFFSNSYISNVSPANKESSCKRFILTYET